VLCTVTIMSSADLRSLNICMVCGCMRMSSVCVCVLGALVSGRSVCELFRNAHSPNSHTLKLNQTIMIFIAHIFIF
jgi:hypothetical protein